ncbi:MAG: helix-turn-helix transcriptional regulator [Candidatus Dadabacteria bacterium]|nr:helix-turn-helix transcriptional regulator [Candidatus Dadabacteria bacterium]
MSKILNQIKNRRKYLSFKQKDMMLRIGMSKQQYQRLESRGNPRLHTLELIAKGLRMEVLLIPQEKLRAIRDILEGRTSTAEIEVYGGPNVEPPHDDPWEGLLEE